jgi:dimethylglycine dehydrogenase
LVTLEVSCDFAAAHGGDPVIHHGQQVGVVTSGGYGHRVAKNLAYAYVDAAVAIIGGHFKVSIIGQVCDAMVVEPCLYDPANLKPRS